METESTTARRASLERRKQPRQRRARATVERILEATRELIAAEGFASIGTTMIAEKAGVNIASLYQYFPNRETILFGLYEMAANEGAQKLNTLAMKIVHDELGSVVPKILKLILAHYEENAAILLQMANEVPEIRRATRIVPFERMISSTIRLYLLQHPEFSAKDTARHLFFLENLVVSNLSRFVTDPPAKVTKADFIVHLARIIVAYLQGELS